MLSLEKVNHIQPVARPKLALKSQIVVVITLSSQKSKILIHALEQLQNTLNTEEQPVYYLDPFKDTRKLSKRLKRIKVEEILWGNSSFCTFEINCLEVQTARNALALALTPSHLSPEDSTQYRELKTILEEAWSKKYRKSVKLD